MANIKEKLESGSTIIILDTNVLLGLYRHSPQWSDFGLKCLEVVSSYLVLPYTVKIEYENNYRALFSSVKERISKYDNCILKCIDDFELESLAACDEIEKKHFPNVSDLKNGINECVASIRGKLQEYSETQAALEIINQVQAKSDNVYTFFKNLINANQTMNVLTIDLIYQLCEEGKKRYKKEMPPGFMDAKNKDGVRKYGDYIIWFEIMQYAKNNNLDIIFVTDDAKADWWESNDSGKTFHNKLSDEFNKNTRKQIEAYTSSNFFLLISQLYRIPEFDVIETVLSITAQTYGEDIRDSVFESISEQFCCYPERYLDDYEEISSLDGFELDDGSLEYTLLSANFSYSDEGEYYYLFKYRVKILAESHEYWGRDEDTRDVILSPANWHTYEGEIEVEVIRSIGDIGDLPYETSFDSAEIASGDLEQTEYTPYSFTDDYEDEEQRYNTCPRCGNPITFETDALNGFCINCPD